MVRCYLLTFTLGILFLIYGCNLKPAETQSLCISNGEAKILNLKKKYKAGDHISVQIYTKNLDNENILIAWDGKFGQQFFEKQVYSDDFLFAFPDSISTQSGKVTIKVIHCDKILANSSTYISSLHSVGTIESYLGPKTLAIDQNLESMLCLIPTDKFGNAMETNDTVLFNTKYSNLPNQEMKKGVKNLLSFIKIKNNKELGKVLLGAKCHDTYIDEQELAIVQGPMQDVKINIMSLHPYSDQRQRVHLNTNLIYDAMGNVVADGTSVVFVIHENGEMKAQYQSYTVSGIATVYIENPMQATNWEVNILGAPDSSKINISFMDNIESIPLRIEKDHLVVGPVVGSFEQYIPDGTNVSITFNYSISRSLEIEHGFAKVKIPDTILESDEIICEVAINGQIVKLIY